MKREENEYFKIVSSFNAFKAERKKIQESTWSLNKDNKDQVLYAIDIVINSLQNQITALVYNDNRFKSYLQNIGGIDPKMAGVLFAYIDVNRFKHVNILYKYAGVLNGSTINDFEGDGVVEDKIKYNKALNKKLKIMAHAMIAKDSIYAQYYWDRMVYLNHKKLCGGEKVVQVTRADMAKEAFDEKLAKSFAIDYMLQRFLRDYWIAYGDKQLFDSENEKANWYGLYEYEEIHNSKSVGFVGKDIYVDIHDMIKIANESLGEFQGEHPLYKKIQNESRAVIERLKSIYENS